MNRDVFKTIMLEIDTGRELKEKLLIQTMRQLFYNLEIDQKAKNWLHRLSLLHVNLIASSVSHAGLLRSSEPNQRFKLHPDKMIIGLIQCKFRLRLIATFAS